MPFLQCVLHAIANDGHHIAVFHDVEFVGNPAVSRNNIGAAFLFMLRDCNVNNVIQRVDFTLNRPSPLQIDETDSYSC